MANRPLGHAQQDVLDALKRRGYWTRNCGWHWNGWNSTEKIMESLVRRGLVVKLPYGEIFEYQPAPDAADR